MKEKEYNEYNKEYNLERFVEAQNEYGTYELALSEIKAGRKRSHWIWFIFPQLKGLGSSYNAQYYGIEDSNEAKEYLEHPVLGPRLLEISEALLKLQENDPAVVMGGSPDDMKLKSSMTLFAAVSEAVSEAVSAHDSVFHRVLEKFFGGKMDEKTLKILRCVRGE